MKLNPFRLLCAAGLFAIFSSTVSKNPALPLFTSYLGADPSTVGMVAAVSAFTGIVASIPAGILADRWGKKRMLVLSGIVFASAPFLYLLITQIWQLAIIRFYHGLATAIFVPVSMASIAGLFHAGRGERMGWFSTATLIGRFMAPVVGGAIIGAMALNPDIGYKAVYLVSGGAGIVVLLLALKIQDTGGDVKNNREWRETLRAFKTVISNKGIVWTCAVEAAILFAYGTFETFVPLYSLKIGLSAYAVGIFLSAQVITLALTKPVMGRFSDKHGRRHQIIAGAALGAACIGAFSLFTAFVPLLLLSMSFGLCLSIVTSATSAAIADMSKKETHGGAMGTLGSIMDVGHTTGPLISGFVAAYFGLAFSFIGASIALLCVAFVFLLGTVRTQAQYRQQ
ncbi:MAG: MFS transporter [Deltaproteobacteria bacterium]|nr:MFS transporter [Deltaproteobacteria bacterium]